MSLISTLCCCLFPLAACLQGVLLQIFTKPLGDRPTVFFEIIQRLCTLDVQQVGAAGGIEGRGGSIGACTDCSQLEALTQLQATEDVVVTTKLH